MNANPAIPSSPLISVNPQPAPDLDCPFAAGVDGWRALVSGSPRGAQLWKVATEPVAAGVITKRGRRFLGMPRDVVDFLLGRYQGATSRRRMRP